MLQSLSVLTERCLPYRNTFYSLIYVRTTDFSFKEVLANIFYDFLCCMCAFTLSNYLTYFSFIYQFNENLTFSTKHRTAY